MKICESLKIKVVFQIHPRFACHKVIALLDLNRTLFKNHFKFINLSHPLKITPIVLFYHLIIVLTTICLIIPILYSKCPF